MLSLLWEQAAVSSGEAGWGGGGVNEARADGDAEFAVYFFFFGLVMLFTYSMLSST